MNFINQIIQCSQVKEAKLYGPSQKALERPETGITIQTPAAFYVIKDCATIAHNYLPHFVFGSYANPFEALKGKFTREDIEEFISSAMKDLILHQLLTLILEKIKKTQPIITADLHSVDVISSHTGDPYGDYEDCTGVVAVQKVPDPLTLLCTAFGVV